MNKNSILVFLIFTIFFLPIAFHDSSSLRQVAGKIILDIKPGESSEIEWGLSSDYPNQVTTVELSAEGEGSEFLTFEKNLNIEPLKTIYTKVQINIPADYPGGIELTPRLLATEFGEKGGATVINIRMLKTVNLNIDLNDDPNLWVDWDALKAEKAGMLEQTTTKQEEKQGGGVQITQSEKTEPVCGKGTHLENGQCVPDKAGGGCLIATATFGSELAPQVQMLREIRDNSVLSTSSGTLFMAGFNQLYYTFSPTIADWERQNPVFKDSMKIFVTPMISSLSLMSLAEPGSEESILVFGMSIIALNLGMYIVAPAIISYKAHKYLDTRKIKSALN